MGNRNCGLFNDGRDGADHLYVDGISSDENRIIKDVYKNMDIASIFNTLLSLKMSY